MGKILQKEMEELKKMFFQLGTLVEEAFQNCVKSLETRDSKLAKEVIDGDPKIDALEVHLEEECLKILALHQPVAFDLRFIIALLKINNDLERIGDLAVNIAKRALKLSKQNSNYFPLNFKEMINKTKEMLGKSLDALTEYDSQMAYQVCAADDEIDEINRKLYSQIKEEIRSQPDQLDPFIHFLSISRFLERIADHATNMAEDVIYLVEGEIIRHKTEDLKAVKN